MVQAQKALFTPDDANRALPLVRAIATDLVAEFRRLRLVGRERRAEGAQGRPPAPGGDSVEDLSARVEGCLRELADLGLEVRDLELGLVDFPALMGSEPAFLCWRLGEPTVAYWHSADRGHAERQPIDAALLSLR